MMTQVQASKISRGKYKIKMPNGEIITMNSSGLFDTERELFKFASEVGNVLGIAADDQLKRYFLVYEGETYDVIMSEEDKEVFAY